MTILSIVWDPSTGIDLGFFTFRFYSLMWLCAFGVGLWIMSKIFKIEKLSEDQLSTTLYLVFWGTLIGARVGHCVFYEWGYYKDHILEIILPFELSPFKLTGYRGLASHGAAIGILVAMYFCARYLKKPFLWLMDRLVIVVALGGAFIRIGNLMNSEIIGKPTTSSFGIIFKQLGESFPRHPAQLYEAFGYLVLFVLIWMMYKKGLARYQGLIFGVFMIILFSVRFVVEFYKENQEAFENTMPINMGQILSLPFIFAGAILVLWSLRKNNNK